MTAAERERPENPVPPRSERSDVDDPPEALASSYPLHDALAMSRELLLPIHERSAQEASRLAARLRLLTLWSVGAGFAALALLALQISLPSWMPAPSAAATNAIRIAEAAAAALALGAGGWNAASGASRKSVLEVHRAERCRLLKYRFLVDPAVWTRRGSESEDRRERFRRDAGEIQTLTADRLADWTSRDTVAFAPTLPVGSGIDTHTVHTLVDYYQERRLDPRLEELGHAIRRSPARDGVVRLSSALFFAAVALVAAHLLLDLPFVGLASSPRVPRAIWSAVAAAVAVVLPALAMAFRLSRDASGLASDRARLAGAHHALSELSGRLQKASGAEAIFRELGFCEDVMETHHREWLRTRRSGV